MLALVFQHRMAALEAASHVAHSAIIPFYGIPHLVQMLRGHTSAVKRDALLGVLGALAANRGNAQALVRCGGVALLVKMAAMVHVDRQGSSSKQAAMTSNLLEAGKPTLGAQDEYRYWYLCVRVWVGTCRTCSAKKAY